MTMRTVQLLGYGYGATPANITVVFNGQTVFSGNTPTQDTPLPAMPADQDLLDNVTVLATFELPMDTQGQIPMSCVVNNGTVIFADIVANYCQAQNNQGQWVAIQPSQTTFQSVNSNQGDCRSNVMIDGVAQQGRPEGSPLAGSWWWLVHQGSTLAYDVNVVAGLEIV